MSHSYNKIWVHAIWSTKNRTPFITRSIESRLFPFIKNEFQELGCTILIINGWTEHIHCLFLLNPKKSMSGVIKQIKGSSSFFINKENLTSERFSWQVGYAAFSVSESVRNKVYAYIKNQKTHHQKKNYQLELDAFLKLHQLNEKG
jgi:putative transposase